MSTTQLIPLAITMMAGPQILSAIIFVTGDNPVKVSLAYVAAVGVAAATVVLVGLLILASIKAYLGRETAEPPKWLGKLQDAGPGRAFQLGLLLIFLMPSDFIITMTTGLNLKGNAEPYYYALPFIGLTTLVAALPLLFYLLFRERARATLPKLRDWMNANSWAVNIIVYGIFIV